MTLIIGTAHWNGICLVADTRATSVSSRSYQDNAMKVSHVHGGIGMVAAGDRDSAVVFRECLRSTLDSVVSTGLRFDGSVDLTGVMELLIKSAMKSTREHSIQNSRPIYDTSSTGLIGVSLADQPLILDVDECNNLGSVIVNGARGMPIEHWFYQKYLTSIFECAKGEMPSLTIEEYHKCVLYRYRLKLFDDDSQDIYEVEYIPFGKIMALGSGSRFDYLAHQDRTLFFTLFQSGFDVDMGAIHLSSIAELAEQEIEESTGFSFRTFGGAIVPASIMTHPNGNGETRIVLCDLGSKVENRIVSKTYNKDGALWVETRSGKNIKLEVFPDSLDQNERMWW